MAAHPKPPLDAATVARLRMLLMANLDNVVAHLCHDLMATGDFTAYDEGTVPREALKSVTVELIRASRRKPAGLGFRVYNQGLDRLAAGLERATEPVLRQVSVQAEHERYVVTCDPALERLVGAVRMPLDQPPPGG